MMLPLGNESEMAKCYKSKLLLFYFYYINKNTKKPKFIIFLENIKGRYFRQKTMCTYNYFIISAVRLRGILV